MKKNLTSIQDCLIVRKYTGSTIRVGNNAKKLTPYEKPLSFSFLAFSAGVLRSESDSSLEKWWNGKRGTGDWLGARSALEDRGINLTGKWIGTFYGVAAGGLDPRGAFDQSLHFDPKADFAKLAGWNALEGLTAQDSGGLQRRPHRPSNLRGRP